VWHSLAVVVILGCGSDKSPPPKRDVAIERPTRPPDPFKSEREYMVDTAIAKRGVSDHRVLEAMRSVPRHELVPLAVRDQAYADRPLPIGHDKTISQPYIVAIMTEAVQLHAGDKVLEIGTGSGYQAAVLAELSAHVYTIEYIEALANQARNDLVRIGYKDVQVRTGDGYRGWPEAAPFDAIIVTAAAPRVPPPLLEQLAIGGRLVMPLGSDDEQSLVVITRGRTENTTQTLIPVRFGPLLGEAHDATTGPM
jgi:protein-L-isoaspartate(D-aspartate) O-methyltransferase